MICQLDGCDKALQSNNKSGYCTLHWTKSPSAREKIKIQRDKYKWRNLDITDITARRAACDGHCEICGKHESEATIHQGKLLYVDHDHVTNKFRGLLCHDCNLMISYAKDDTTTLKKAIEYLERGVR